MEQPPDYARRASSWVNLNLKFKGDEWHSGNEAIESILNGLLKQVQPEAVAAEVLKCPVDKIVMVPRIFWSESKWVDWAEKVNREQGAEPTAGPDDKIYLCAELNGTGAYALLIELGPGVTDETASKIVRRIAAKMIREAPDFSQKFLHQGKLEEFDRLSNRIRDLNNEADKLRNQTQEVVGLSQAQLSERVRRFAAQLLTADLSVQVMKAREKAIREQLAEVKAETKTSTSEAIGTLKRIVELRKARFERLKTAKSTNAVSQEDVEKAEEEMLAAQVDLDRAAAVLQKSDSQSQLDPLAADLRKIVVDRAEAEARMVFLANANQQSMDALAHRRDADARNDRLQAQLKGIERHRSDLQDQLNQAEDTLNKPAESLQLWLNE